MPRSPRTKKDKLILRDLCALITKTKMNPQVSADFCHTLFCLGGGGAHLS